MYNTYKVRVPDTITREYLKVRLIDANLPEHSKNEILIDKMLYVIHTLHRKLLFDGIVDDEDLINLKSVYLKDTLGRSGGVSYKDVIECLKRTQILQVRESYLSGIFSKGYGLRLSVDYEIHTLELLHWTPLSGKKTIQQSDSVTSKVKSATRENIKKIGVDTEYIHQIIKREADQFTKTYYNYFIKSLRSGNDIDIYAEADDYGRLHHNITGVARELRPALSIDGEEIYCVDISASQLYFSIKGFESYLRMKANTANIFYAKEKYPDSIVFIDSILSGSFYASINKKLQLSDEDLKANKINILMPLFSQKEPKRKSKYFKALSDMFPTYMTYVKTLKRDTYKDAARHLQTVESSIVINKIAVRLVDEGMWFLTVHDSVLCTKHNIGKVHRIIQEECTAVIGYQPHLKVSLWSGVKMDFSSSLSKEEREKRTSTLLHRLWTHRDKRTKKKILRKIKNDKNKVLDVK